MKQILVKNIMLLTSSIIIFAKLTNAIYDISDDAKIRIGFKLKEKFRKSLGKLTSTQSDMEHFQLDLFVNRNIDCEKLKQTDFIEFDKLKSEDLEKSVLKKWANFTSVLEKNQNEKLANILSDEIANDLSNMCLDIKTIRRLFKIDGTDNSQVNQDVAEILITQMTNQGCNLCPEKDEHQRSTLWPWIFGFIAATCITITSFTGAFLIPFTKHKHYRKILMFLISLAIGTLIGTATVHLIPQAFGIADDVKYSAYNKYIWKCLVIFIGIYIFFLVEQIMRLLIQLRKHKREQSERKTVEMKNLVTILNDQNQKDLREIDDGEEVLNNKLNRLVATSISSHIHQAHTDIQESSHKSHELATVIAPVAWIIICGESLHNLIDGLSIGAAFTETLMKGFNISIAIIMEEFPHKLGDFAILLAAGMPFKVALLCNFLTSSIIYIGVVIGIVLGENLNANQWIYAIAGGMFLYIAVCDMIPELIEMGEEIEKEYQTDENDFLLNIKLRNLFFQNFGILLGFFAMLLMAIFSKQIGS